MDEVDVVAAPVGEAPDRRPWCGIEGGHAHDHAPRADVPATDFSRVRSITTAATPTPSSWDSDTWTTTSPDAPTPGRISIDGRPFSSSTISTSPSGCSPGSAELRPCRRERALGRQSRRVARQGIRPIVERGALPLAEHRVVVDECRHLVDRHLLHRRAHDRHRSRRLGSESVTIRIGGGQGFYGDGHAPVADLLADGIDYLVCEALAELTLAILQKDRQRDESLGYARDLPLYVGAAVPYLVDGRTRFITNAGGINPIAAGRAVVSTASARHGVDGPEGRHGRGRRRPPPRRRARPARRHAVRQRVRRGAARSSRRSSAGADIVICGRVADASLFLAPLVHEFGWAWDDWDRLAAGVTAGHLLECSGQVTGGNYSGDWWNDADPLPRRVPHRRVRARRHVRRHQAGRHRRAGLVRHGARAAALRGARPGRVPEPRRHRRPRRGPARGPRRRPGAGDRRPRRARRPRRTRAWCARRPAGPARRAWPTRWPDAEAKARAALAFLRAPGRRDRAWTVEEWSRGVLRRQRVRRTDGRRRRESDYDPAEVMARLAWRCATRRGGGPKLGREVGVLGLVGPTDDRRRPTGRGAVDRRSCSTSTRWPSPATSSTARSRGSRPVDPGGPRSSATEDHRTDR